MVRGQDAKVNFVGKEKHSAQFHSVQFGGKRGHLPIRPPKKPELFLLFVHPPFVPRKKSQAFVVIFSRSRFRLLLQGSYCK